MVGRGRLIADAPVAELIAAGSPAVTYVRAPRADDLRARLEEHGARVDPDPAGGWRVVGPDAAKVGELAARHALAVHELRPLRSSLEDVYRRLTAASVEHRAVGHPADAPGHPAHAPGHPADAPGPRSDTPLQEAIR
ncbi:MAG TPA: hypothetical protein VIL48_18250 [Acidimicrobiales bacterium]